MVENNREGREYFNSGQSRRFPDAMGGMDDGFSLCAVPAFCRGSGILNICRCMCVPQGSHRVGGCGGKVAG